MFSEADCVTIDGMQIDNGSLCELAEGTYQVNIERAEQTSQFNMAIRYSSNIASMFLKTESGSMDYLHESKENFERGEYTLFAGRGNLYYTGNIEDIHCRGNASWEDTDKKSYQIKLTEKKDLLGMGADKQWILLANAFDNTLMRNTLAFDIAQELGVSFTPDSECVDVYANGQYIGNYLLTEKIEIDKERVNILNLEEQMELMNKEKALEEYEFFMEQQGRLFSTKGYRIEKQPEDISGGYLLEIEVSDRYGLEASGFMTSRMQLSATVYPESFEGNYDVIVIGSDQVWNPKITNGFDDVYFAQFPFAKAMKRYVAYAASMEAKKLEDEEISFYKSRLSNFDAISVREKELLSLLQVHVDQPIKQVLDPTLMVSSDLWDKLSSKKKIKGKYVVVYQVRNNKNTLRIANYIANQLNAKVVVLVAWLQINYQNTYQTASPEDFVNIIRNAACVVTTSFHGTAFSIIFNRPFYTVRLNDGADSRSSSLLESLGLENRMINIDDSPVFTTIDYTAVNPRLNSLRQQSQEFLLSNL